MTSEISDLILIAAANFVSLTIAAMFVTRVRGPQQAATTFSNLALWMIPPIAGGTVVNALGRRDLWLIALPALLLAHLVLTLLLDHVLRINFRQTRWLGPYLLVYYLGSMGMIGYAFLVDDTAGFITLTTYYVNLGATWYSYARVGHGRAVLQE